MDDLTLEDITALKILNDGGEVLANGWLRFNGELFRVEIDTWKRLMAHGFIEQFTA